MSDEEIARHYAKRRPGFHLVSYRRVAMPMFHVTLRVLTIEEREVPPIPLFIMKSVDAGLKRAEEIASFLGLENDVIKAGVIYLLQSGNLILGSQDADRSHRLLLTEKGSATLSSLVMQLPEVIEVSVVVDGLTRQLVTDVPLISPKSLKSNNLTEIAPYPSYSTISLNEIYPHFPDFFKTYIWGGRNKRTVIDVLEIEGEPERLFRDDVLALVYKSSTDAQVEIGFTVHGLLSTEHEVIFKRSEQSRQLSLLPNNIEGVESVLAEVVGSEMVERIQPAEETDDLILQVDASRETITRLKGRLGKTDSQSEKITLEKQLMEAQAKLQSLKESLDAIDVRWLEVYEHPAYLEDALTLSKERLMIIAPWITGSVVTPKFLSLLESRLKKNVEVFIGYGFPDRGKSINEPATIKKLEELAQKFHNFHFKKLGNTHAKVLASDRRYTIATSFNWLSFQGDPTQPFIDQRGFYVNIPDKIDQCFDSRAIEFGMSIN